MRDGRVGSGVDRLTKNATDRLRQRLMTAMAFFLEEIGFQIVHDFHSYRFILAYFPSPYYYHY